MTPACSGSPPIQIGEAPPLNLPAVPMTMPPLVDPKNVYSEAAAGHISPAANGALPRIYAPNNISGKVDVIDPATFKVVDSFPAGRSPQHVVPSWDLQTLWVTSDVSGPRAHGQLTPIDPKTGKPGTPITVPDAYNMYFTPDGNSAIVVAEALRRLEFRNPKTMELQGAIDVPQCAGINHADFSLDGSYAIFTCEFGDSLVKIDLVKHQLYGVLSLSKGHMPQDIRVSPDGSVFYVADLLGDGIVKIDGAQFKEVGFIPTGVGAHGLYPEPRRQGSLCHQSRHPHASAGRRRVSRQRQRVRLRHRKGRGDLAGAQRRQPRHGQCQRRWRHVMALRPLQRRGLRLQHHRRQREDGGRRRHAPRAHRLAAARTLFPRTYRQYALSAWTFDFASPHQEPLT